MAEKVAIDRAAQRARGRNKLALATALGALVFIISLLSVWVNLGSTIWFSTEVEDTARTLRQMETVITAHMEDNGEYPERLAEVRFDVDLTVVRDGWGRPFQYERTTNGYRLWSLGADGKPGGVGADTDQHAGGVGSINIQPSLWEFVRSGAAKGYLVSCALTAVIAAILGWFLGGSAQPKPSRSTWIKVIAGTAVTVVVSVFLATLLAALCVPPGHH